MATAARARLPERIALDSALLFVQIGDVVRYAISRPEPLRLEHEAFRDAVLGRGDSIVTLEQGLRVVEVAEAILASARGGLTVDLREAQS